MYTWTRWISSIDILIFNLLMYDRRFAFLAEILMQETFSQNSTKSLYFTKSFLRIFLFVRTFTSFYGHLDFQRTYFNCLRQFTDYVYLNLKKKKFILCYKSLFDNLYVVQKFTISIFFTKFAISKDFWF